MFDLVADIARYPEFLNWCGGTQIIEDSGTEVIASITIDFKGIHKTFTTRNHMQPGRAINVSLVDGPFSDLRGTWRFTPLEDSASKVEFEMEFSFSNRIIEKLVGPVFAHIANHQVDAFLQRAKTIHGG